jgi:hypothetical protein
MQYISELKQLDVELTRLIRNSDRKCCCFHLSEIIFGRTDQAKAILTETFEGCHAFVEGPDGNKIDCMFFPCTSKEKVVIDEKQDYSGVKKVACVPKGHNSIN